MAPLLVVPYHFGNDANASVANVFMPGAYLILTSKDRSMYRDIFPDMAASRFTDADFNQPGSDAGLYRLYTNGEFDTWLINKKSSH